MPAYCAPPPGNRKATGGASAALALRRISPGVIRRSFATASARSAQTRATRFSNRRRPTSRVWATSARLAVLCCSSQSARSAQRLASAPSVRAERTRSCGPAAASVASRTGASSTSRWALVPPRPNELTPARRGALPRFHLTGLAATKNGEPSKAMLGLGAVKFRLGGMTSFSSARTALMRPAAVAPASRWPMLVLTEPRAQKPAYTRSRVERAGQALDLDGVAQDGAVPCASIMETESAEIPALL